MSSDDAAQSQPTEPEQAQTSSTDPVVSMSDPTVSAPQVSNDEPVKTEEPVATPVSSEPIVEDPTATEQPSPVAEVKQEPVIETATEKPVESTAQESIQQDQPDGESVVQPTEPTDQKEQIVERIIEKEKPLTPETRHEIFKEELAGHLSEANKAKHEHYEKHLQEIVDFIRKKATLVTNREIEAALDVPDSTIVDRLNELIGRGVVTRIGEGEHTKYRLTQGL